MVEEEIYKEDVTDDNVRIEYGTVTGCAKLNIRKEPNLDSDIVGVIDSGTELMVDHDHDFSDWYSVECLSKNIRGYCKAEYVSINQ